MHALPRILITLGDVAGIGPEIILKSWSNLALFAQCQPVVIGDATWLRKQQGECGFRGTIQRITGLDNWPESSPEELVCLQGTSQDLTHVQLGKPQAVAGQAAFDFLDRAIALTLEKQADGIVTAPLHKEGLHAAGLHFPGHTEILAKKTGTERFAMMLFGGSIGVAHVTLHQSMKSIFEQITTANVLQKIELTHQVMTQLVNRLRDSWSDLLRLLIPE